MIYYAHINSKGKLVDVDMSEICKDEYGSTNVLNIQIPDEYYINYKKYGSDYYIYLNNEIIVNPEWAEIELQRAKAEKVEYNDELRDTALLGGVTYNNVLFDSDTDQKVNLLSTVETLSDEDTIIWYGMNNEPLLCNKEDLYNIGYLIKELTTYCWTHNSEIKQEIYNASTIEELDSIVIDYNRKE